MCDVEANFKVRLRNGILKNYWSQDMLRSVTPCF